MLSPCIAKCYTVLLFLLFLLFHLIHSTKLMPFLRVFVVDRLFLFFLCRSFFYSIEWSSSNFLVCSIVGWQQNHYNTLIIPYLNLLCVCVCVFALWVESIFFRISCSVSTKASITNKPDFIVCILPDCIRLICIIVIFGRRREWSSY